MFDIQNDLIQAENAKSFIDLTQFNIGNDKAYRADSLDVYLSADKTVRYVGSIQAGERLNYSIEVPTAAVHRVDFSVATNSPGVKSFDVLVNGVYQDTVEFSRTGADLGWEKFQNVSANVRLTGANDEISIVAKTSFFNIDSLKIAGVVPSTDSETSTKVVINNNFDSSPLGTYTMATLNKEWNYPTGVQGVREGRARIVGGSSAYRGQALEITYPAGLSGPGSRALWQATLGGSYQEVVLSYYLKFAANFPFNLERNSGKLLGLGGGDIQWGGDKPDGYDGWSARLTWGEGSSPNQYVYHVDQPKNIGQSYDYLGADGKQIVVKQETWYKFETRVVMNTPGQNNGIVQGKIDGVLAMDKRDFNFRETDAFAIDTFAFSTFFGGSSPEYAPPQATRVTFDEIEVRAITRATDPIIGDTSLLVYEAENLDTLTNFRIERVSAASKGYALSLVGGAKGEVGKATLQFGDDPKEAAGQYRLSLRYFDENDGRGQIRVLHSDVETSSTRLLGSFYLDRSSGSHIPVAANLFTYDLPTSVLLTPGDKIHIEGYENLSEHIRIDQLLLERL